MKHLYVKVAGFALLLLNMGFAGAQDTRFSQPLNNQLWVNPAAMDLTNDARVSLNYRNQWATIQGGYQTYAGSVMCPLYLRSRGSKADSAKGEYGRSRLDFGLNVTDDKSGAFNRIDATVDIGFGLKVDAANTITAALNFGYLQYSFGTMGQTFDEQYQFGALNTSLPTNESLAGNKGAPDVGLGLLWHFAPPSGKIQAFAGLSGFHVNQPNMTLNNGDGKLPARFNFHAGVKIISNKVDFTPVILYDLQGPFQQLVAGLLVDYKFGNNAEKGKLQLGAYYKQNDAIPVQIGYGYKFLLFAYSYDFGISQLARVTPGLMTHELTLAFQLYDIAAKKGVRAASFF